MTDDDAKQRMQRRIERVQRAYDGHGPVIRALWVVAGVIVLLAGLAMTVFPGPAMVVVPVGLAMLGAAFGWARRLLAVGVDRGFAAKERLDAASTAVKLVGGAALVGAALLIVIAVVWV